MIFNIIDRRVNTSRWKMINAIIEPTWHSNCRGVNEDHGDDAPIQEHADDYQELVGVSINHAIGFAQDLDYAVTLFIYNHGDGVTITKYMPNKLEEKVFMSIPLTK